jgi:hypothetical protein
MVVVNKTDNLEKLQIEAGRIEVTNSTNLSWNVISISLGRLMLENTIALVF